ncbi:unnamed protein product, partial [marine sediment metagenome]
MNDIDPRRNNCLLPLAWRPAGCPISVDTPAQFGTPPDYAEFEADGTLAFYGAATTWRDELGALTGSRLESPASDIVINFAESHVPNKPPSAYSPGVPVGVPLA